jgi:hypothetical protein
MAVLLYNLYKEVFVTEMSSAYCHTWSGNDLLVPLTPFPAYVATKH